jgi:hypothetical protein
VKTNRSFWRLGVALSVAEFSQPYAVAVAVSEDAMSIDLSDGRTIAAPISWYPRLAHGAAKERGNWQLIGGGEGIHWLDLDEDISVNGLLAGRRCGERQASLQQWLARRAENA